MHGPDSGVHLIMAFRPDAEDSNSTEHVAALLKLKAVVRIVGRVADARQSQAAALAPQLGAQNLLGRGDFLVTDEEKSVRVQTAFVDEYDLHWVLESLQRRRPPTVVARPTSSRPWIPGASSSEEPVQQFSFDGHEIRLREEAEVPGFEQ
jgi:DNA segregation ATPase FtsK/SpoIIIE-like protein